MAFFLLICGQAHAESHRATRLGHPATRFAPPLATPADVRARFSDSKLQLDIASVLKQWGWQGRFDDLISAGKTADIADITIPVGDVMPFMSSRENGKPVCLRNVTWAGNEPAPAFAFHFNSVGRRYRCVIPKACSNFFLEDLGMEPRHELTIDCSSPEKAILGRNIEVCVTVRNNGNVVENQILVALPVPSGVVATEARDEGVVANDSITWQNLSVPAGSSKRLCATLKANGIGPLGFKPALTCANVKPVQSSCETSVSGISALLLETSDDPDPIPIGDTTTYVVKVTNQGTADDTNVRVVVEFPAELDPVSASNSGQVVAKTVSFPPFERLSPKQAFEFRIIAKGANVGDARVRFIRTSDDIPAPTTAEESTRVY